jgi:protein-arginine kinase
LTDLLTPSQITDFAADYFTSTAELLPRGINYDEHGSSLLSKDSKLAHMVDLATRFAKAFGHCSTDEVTSLALSIVARVADVQVVERDWQIEHKPISRKLTYEEAGEAMGLTSRQFRSLLTKARDHLRIGIEEQLREAEEFEGSHAKTHGRSMYGQRAVM